MLELGQCTDDELVEAIDLLHGLVCLAQSQLQGGDMDNLVWLCPQHHRLVHEGGWTMRGDPNDTLTFVRPDGRPLASRRGRAP